MSEELTPDPELESGLNEETDDFDDVDVDESELAQLDDENLEDDDVEYEYEEEEYEEDEHEAWAEDEEEEEDEYEEISSEEVDRVVTVLEDLMDSVQSENISTYLEYAIDEIFYLVYTDDDLESSDDAPEAEAA